MLSIKYDSSSSEDRGDKHSHLNASIHAYQVVFDVLRRVECEMIMDANATSRLRDLWLDNIQTGGGIATPPELESCSRKRKIDQSSRSQTHKARTGIAPPTSKLNFQMDGTPNSSISIVPSIRYLPRKPEGFRLRNEPASVRYPVLYQHSSL